MQVQYKSEILFKPKPDTIQDRLNELARDGWILETAIPQQGGDVVIILRKDRP